MKSVTRRDILRGIGISGLGGLGGCLTSNGRGSKLTPSSNVVRWPMSRGGSRNRSYVPLSSASSGVEMSWEFSPSTDKDVQMQPSVSEELVLLAADKIYAINRTTGETSWEFSSESQSEEFQAPVLGENEAYIAHESTDRSYLTVVELVSGEQQWSMEITESLWDPPTVDGDSLYLPYSSTYRGFGNDNYYSTFGTVDVREQTERWTLEIDNRAGSGFSTPATTESAVFTSLDDTLYSFSKSTGQSKWSTPVNPYGPPPCVSNGRVYVSLHNELKAVSTEHGDELWRQGSQGVPTIAVGDERIYCGHSNGLSSHSAETGDVDWEVDITARAQPTVSRDSVYLADDRTLYELSSDDGSVRWEEDIDEHAIAQPVLDGDRLYVTTSESIYCYELK